MSAAGNEVCSGSDVKDNEVLIQLPVAAVRLLEDVSEGQVSN